MSSHGAAFATEGGSGAPAISRAIVAAFTAGVLAGAATGLIDGLWSWRGLGQFAPATGGKLRSLLFLASIHGLAGAVVATAATLAVLALVHGTRIGAIARALGAAHRRARQRDPASALLGLSLVIAGLPALGAALAVGFWAAHDTLHGRKHIGLVIAMSMAIALGAVAVAVVLAFALGRVIEIGLGRLVRRAPAARALSSPVAPLVAALLLGAIAAAIAVRVFWPTLSLLPLRPLWVALVFAALYPAAHATGRRVADRLMAARPLVRRGLPAAVLAGLAVTTFVAGAAESAREAAIARSGYGGRLTHVLRRLGDLDRDGYSRLLGGGDCDDGDAAIHPGAAEVPDDGADNNCIGGDVSLAPVEQPPYAPVPAAVPADFHVLLVTIDTLRADHVGAYGYRRPTTPRLDRLASEGALFENAWAHAPSTRYSIPAILTGRYPLEVAYADIPGQWPGLAEENTTIAEVLRGRGLATAAALNYWYFDRKRRMDQGFDEYDNQNQRLHKGIPGEGPAKTRGSSSREQTDRALELLDRIGGGDRRFFLWVHYYDPHFDYERHAGVPTFGTRRVDLYDHEIRYTDQEVGRLFDELARRGQWDRTVVVVTGDHGEGFGEHGIDLHGYHLYAPQTKVPLLIRVPGLTPRRIATPAGHVDILPTLANLAGAAPPAGVSGRSLLDLVAGAEALDRSVFQQLSYEDNHEMRGAASRRCHVIYNVSPDSSWEVYRFDVDPGETRDLSGDADQCREERRALAAWYDRSELPAGAAEALLAARPTVKRALDVDLGDQVRLLAVDLPGSPVRRGATFPVTFTFEARGPLAGGWKVFIHFEGRVGGRFHADHEPPRPLSWWRAGQFIRYTRSVTIPPSARPGAYRAFVGLFRRDRRRPARSRLVPVVDDRAEVGAVQVER